MTDETPEEASLAELNAWQQVEDLDGYPDDEVDLDDLQDIAADTPKEVNLPKGVMPSLAPHVVRWGHEGDTTEHRAIRLGEPSLCSCGWSGTNWTSHLLTGEGGTQAEEK